MPKHENFSDNRPCPNCEQKLTQCHPDLAAWFREEVKPKHPDAHVAWTYRGKDDQNKAFAEGRSKLVYPKSKHNKTDKEGKPCAEAIDLFKLCSNGLASWEWKYFKAIADEIPANMSIDWGGNWKSFPDEPHYELKG